MSDYVEEEFSEFYFEEANLNCTNCKALMSGCKVRNADMTTMELNFGKIKKYCIICGNTVQFN